MTLKYDELFRCKLAKAYEWANAEMSKHNFIKRNSIELHLESDRLKETEGFMESLFIDEATGSVLYRRDWFDDMAVRYDDLTDPDGFIRSAPESFRKMLENGIWLSEQPEYSYYKTKEKETDGADTLSEKEFSTMPIAEKMKRAYRWAKRYQRDHLMIAQRLNLNFESDTVSDGNGFKISLFYDKENNKALLRRDWYDDNEVKTRFDCLMNAEQIKRVAPKSFALMRDNGLKLFMMALRGETLTKRTDMIVHDMPDAFEKYNNGDPEEVLTQMRLFILSCAESFRNGEISEEEFFIKTYVRKDLMDMVIQLKDQISVNYYYSVTENDLNGFIAAFKRWKESGELEYLQWMVKVINTKGNILEAAKWVFRVIDALLIPISSFEPLSKKLYSTPVNQVYDGKNEVSLSIDDQILMDHWDDFDKMFEVGKKYEILYYHSGIMGDLLIKDFKDGEYEAFGVIDGVMTHRQNLRIVSIENKIRILFNSRTFSEYQIKMGTFFNPIPHPDWNQFNAASLSHSYYVEAEYRSLRLPYMLGMITKEMITEDGKKHRDPLRGDKIIPFSDLTKRE